MTWLAIARVIAALIVVVTTAVTQPADPTRRTDAGRNTTDPTWRTDVGRTVLRHDPATYTELLLCRRHTLGVPLRPARPART